MAAQAIAPKTLIGERFEVEASLGAGGLGELYRALDQKTGKPVAIRVLAKEIARSEAVTEQLREQVKLASALAHKNAARVFGMGKEGGHRYVASEFVDGQSLRQLVEKKRRTGKTFSLKSAYNVVAHVCNALEEAHKTMIHGLPGLGAILINRAGRVKLSDFGLVCALTPNSVPIERLGDRSALAPEMQMDPAAAGPAADLYTVGAVIHELLTGQPPSSPPEPMSQLVAGVSQEIEAVVTRCLQVDPARRYANPAELKTAFYQAIQQGGGAEPQLAASPALVPVASQPQQEAVATPAARNALASSAPSLQAVPSSPALAQPAPTAAPRRPISDPFAGAVGPAPATAAAATRGRAVSIEDLLADTSGDDSERWLIQKDRLDFGPFALSDVKQQLYKGAFSGDDVIVDQETGDRGPIRKNALLAEFTRVLERHQQQQNAAKAAVDAGIRERRHRTVLVTIITVSLLVAGAVGFAVWYFVLRKPPESTERIDRDRPSKLKLSINVTFNKEDEDQAKKRRAWKRRRRRRKKRGGASPSAGSDVRHLGDASKAGGDALLSQRVIQSVMAKPTNLNRLTPCVQKQWRRQPSLRKVLIAFGVKGSGQVSYTKVNGKSSGPFQACIARKMRSFRFPKYDGTLTRASFTMTLGY